MKKSKESIDDHAKATCLVLQIFLLFGTTMTEAELRFIFYNFLCVHKKQWGKSYWRGALENNKGDGITLVLQLNLRDFITSEKSELEVTTYSINRRGLRLLLNLLQRFNDAPIIYNDSGKNDLKLIEEACGQNLRSDLVGNVIKFLVHGASKEILMKEIKLILESSFKHWLTS